MSVTRIGMEVDPLHVVCLLRRLKTVLLPPFLWSVESGPYRIGKTLGIGSFSKVKCMSNRWVVASDGFELVLTTLWLCCVLLCCASSVSGRA